MPNASAAAEHLARLRQRAVSRLGAGARADARRQSPSEALTVLHTLASSPATAADALALLHELQVHQVELDLQQEELRASRIELEAALARQQELHDRAPVGLLTMAANGVLIDANAAAARLLGLARDEIPGRSLNSRLSTHGAARLGALLARVGTGDADGGCELELPAATGGPRLAHAHVAADTLAGRFLLALADLGPSGPTPSAN